MIEKFLTAKHWQLFTLTIGIPFIFQIIFMISIFFNFNNLDKNDSSPLLYFDIFFPIMMVLFMGFLWGWIWSIAIGLQSKIPSDVKMKVKKFKVFFFIPLIYIIFFLGTFNLGMEDGPNPAMFAIIFPLHIFSMFCIFYNLYFIAKTFKTVELQRVVKFSDFAGEFFLFWFYPIGIWILQPKINKMIEEKTNANNVYSK